jgi:GntR family transcriptional repressor for pyruvate dehydrogenase complex
MNYKPVSSERIYEQIVSQIEEQVLTGELHEGDRLGSERELAEQFGVGRAAVREAIKVLKEKGLVSVQPGKGTFITNDISEKAKKSLSFLMKLRTNEVDAFRKLIELRCIFEPDIAALAAERATDEDIKLMRSAVETMDRSQDDMDAYVDSDILFHQTIAKATRNDLIDSVLQPIIDLLYEQRKKNYMLGYSPIHAQAAHKRILKAITEKNSQAARMTMKDHLMQVIQDIEGEYSESET